MNTSQFHQTTIITICTGKNAIQFLSTVEFFFLLGAQTPAEEFDITSCRAEPAQGA
jgi:hypothetical protein